MHNLHKCITSKGGSSAEAAGGCAAKCFPGIYWRYVCDAGIAKSQSKLIPDLTHLNMEMRTSARRVALRGRRLARRIKVVGSGPSPTPVNPGGDCLPPHSVSR